MPFGVIAQDGSPFELGVSCEFGAREAVRDSHLRRLNALRLRNGLEPVDANETLNAVAQSYACLLAETGHFDHTGPYGSTPSDRASDGGYAYCYLAENLAKGYPTIGSAIIGWVKSPGHWKNLINKHSVEVGLGVAPVNLSAPLEDDGIGDAPRNGPGSLTELFETLGGGEARFDTPVERFPPHASRYVWVQLFGAPC